MWEGRQEDAEHHLLQIIILNVNFDISKGITEMSTQKRVTCATTQLAKQSWDSP